jgi:methylthioribose-1-phosphate isomerase
MIPTLTWTPDGIRFIDQTKLPLEESYVLATTYEQVAEIIDANGRRAAHHRPHAASLRPGV